MSLNLSALNNNVRLKGSPAVSQSVGHVVAQLHTWYSGARVPLSTSSESVPIVVVVVVVSAVSIALYSEEGLK